MQWRHRAERFRSPSSAAWAAPASVHSIDNRMTKIDSTTSRRGRKESSPFPSNFCPHFNPQTFCGMDRRRSFFLSERQRPPPLFNRLFFSHYLKNAKNRNTYRYILRARGAVCKRLFSLNGRLSNKTGKWPSKQRKMLGQI